MNSKMDYSKIDYTPRAKGMIDAHLYKGLSLFQRILELLDNSREYGSKKIKIYLLSNGNNSSLYKFIILDDGDGMLAELFALCMVLGQQNTHDLLADGKFGLGLKNATWGMGNNIIVLTKTKDGSMRQQYLDLIKMKMDNSLKPTVISEGIDLTIKAMVGFDSIINEFETQESGTLICVNNIIMDIPDVKNAAKKLKDEISLAYRSLECDIDIYTTIDTPFVNITTTKDIFYEKDTTKRKDSSQSCIRVYIEQDKSGQNNQGKVVGVYEELRGKRYGRAQKLIQGTHSKPIFHKLWIDRKKQNGTTRRDMKCEEIKEKDLPKCEYFSCPLTFISIDNDVQKLEEMDDTFEAVPYNRAGIWLYRNNRLMQCSYWPKDITNDPWCNYQRMRFIYPPDLDYHCGTRTEKQLGEITSIAIEEALTVLYNFWNAAAKKMRKEENENKKADVEVQEEVESIIDTRDEYEQLNDVLYGSDESSETDELSEIDEPPKITKAKKPIVAPPVKNDNVITENEQEKNIIVENDDNSVDDVDDDETDEQLDDSESDQEEAPDVIESATTNATNINIVLQSDSSDSSKTNMTVVSGFTRNTPKSEKDVLNKFISIMKNPKLQEKNNCASIVTHPKWTQIYTQLDLFEYELNN